MENQNFTECKGCYKYDVYSTANGKCSECKGTGERFNGNTYVQCHRCKGTGVCPGCGGSGVISIKTKS